LAKYKQLNFKMTTWRGWRYWQSTWCWCDCMLTKYDQQIWSWKC